MRRYIIELNGKYVAATDNIRTSERQYNRFLQKYPAGDNMIKIWDTEIGVAYKAFPLTEENEERD